MGAILAGAAATGLATYAARKATPQTVNENYNFGGKQTEAALDPTSGNTGFNAKRNDPALMDSSYLGTRPTTPGKDTTPGVDEKDPWESGIGGYMKNRMANRFAGVTQKTSPAGRQIGF